MRKIALVLPLLVAVLAVAQDSKLPPRRDPTLPSEKLREAMQGDKKIGPAPVVTKSPGLTLRGRVIAKNKTPAALLETDGRVFHVTTGSVFQSGGSVFKVKEVSAELVAVEVMPLNETLTLR